MNADREPTMTNEDDELRLAILDSLDRLLVALELEPLGSTTGRERFRAATEPGQFDDRVFGGQLVAQAVVAAGATVDEKDPQSLHAYFVAAGDPDRPLELAVDRVRDGRSVSTRHVTITQDDRPVLEVIASFHTNPTSPELGEPDGAIPRPDDLPRLQDWARDLPPERREQGRSWLERPPPLDMRIGEPPSFLDGAPSRESRTHWMRLPRSIGGDPLLHAALLAHASDYLLLDMLRRAHPDPTPVTPGSVAAASLDHSLWIHRPVRFDEWHRYTQETVAFTGHRGLVRGEIHDADGHLVASVMQEGLVRPTR